MEPPGDSYQLIFYQVWNYNITIVNKGRLQKKNGIFYDIGINSCIPQPPPPFYDIINYVIQIYVVDPSLLALIMTLSLIHYDINIGQITASNMYNIRTDKLT